MQKRKLTHPKPSKLKQPAVGPSFERYAWLDSVMPQLKIRSDLAVLLAIVHRCDADTWRTKQPLGFTALEEITGCSRPTICDALDRLEEGGLIERERDEKKGPFWTNTYTLLPGDFQRTKPKKADGPAKKAEDLTNFQALVKQQKVKKGWDLKIRTVLSSYRDGVRGDDYLHLKAGCIARYECDLGNGDHAVAWRRSDQLDVQKEDLTWEIGKPFDPKKSNPVFKK